MPRPKEIGTKAAELVRLAEDELKEADRQLTAAKNIDDKTKRDLAIAEAQSNVNRARAALVNARNIHRD